MDADREEPMLHTGIAFYSRRRQVVGVDWISPGQWTCKRVCRPQYINKHTF